MNLIEQTQFESRKAKTSNEVKKMAKNDEEYNKALKRYMGSQEERIEEGIEIVCNALLDGYMERDFDSITCVCIECNECPFNNINNLKKWMDKYIKEKIKSNK